MDQVIKGSDFIVKTAATGAATHFGASLTLVSQYLGRTFTQMPVSATFAPFVGGVAISVVSDIFELGVNKVLKNHPKTNAIVNMLVRVIVGAGLFAAGAAATGGAIVPALITGAAVGALVYVANKVAKFALDILKVGIMLGIGILILIAPAFKFKSTKPLDNCFTSLNKSLSPENLKIIDAIARFFKTK